MFKFDWRDRDDLTQIFNPQEKGWLGGDVATSIKLNESRYVWIFGDTLIGYVEDGQRKIIIMSHDSIAITEDSNFSKPIFYLPQFSSNNTIDPRGFFHPNGEREDEAEAAYWTVAGLLLPKSQLLVILAMVIIYPANTFSQIGTDIIVVENPFEDSPQFWKYSSQRIPITSNNLTFNDAIASDGNSTYIVGLQSQGGNLLLSKFTSETDLINYDWIKMEFWCGKQMGWTRDVTNAVPLLTNSPFTETTLFFHPIWKQWYMVLSQAWIMNVSVAFATDLTGPWQSVAVFPIPEKYQNTSKYICYAAKSHPEYVTQNSSKIIFSYNVNTLQLRDLTDLDIYHPKFVEIDIFQNDEN